MSQIFFVLLPYRFTLFSNNVAGELNRTIVLLPYRFTLFSNIPWVTAEHVPFYYLIDLHYSQTISVSPLYVMAFYYLIDLHYSQTPAQDNVDSEVFYYLIDLHYSQTGCGIT